jgi:hypothetical protein
MDGGATSVTAASLRWQAASDRLLVQRAAALGSGRDEDLGRLLGGLREYGWVEGQNLLIEGSWVEGHTERHGPYAEELVLSQPWRASLRDLPQG